MASNIGIKIANGEFYPIMEENSSIKKRIILTTVHDNQPSVQIDLYRSPASTMPDAQYIGSLVVENIKPKPKGDPSIEMIISSDENGEIAAEAVDLDTGSSGEHYMLNVSLRSMDDTSHDIGVPDFELESNEEPPSSLYQHAKKIRQKSSSKSWIFVLLVILIILGLLAGWLFYYGGLDVVRSFFDKAVVGIEKTFSDISNTVSEKFAKREIVKEPEPTVKKPEPEPEPVKPAEPVKQTEPVQQKIEPAPVIQAPATAPEPKQRQKGRTSNAPVMSYKVPTTIPREGVNYKIRWGDTLWDIAEAFYRNPWLYPKIAKYNNIRNPNLIISGRTIRIPPKN